MTTTLPTASDAASRAADAAQFARLGLLAGGQHWLVRLDDASEVVAVGAITPVPLTRPWFCGLSNIRGSLYSVIDLGQFLGGPPTVLTVEARLVLINERYHISAALLVDRMLGLRTLNQLVRCDPPPDRPFVFDSYRDPDQRLWHEIAIGELVYQNEFLNVGL